MLKRILSLFLLTLYGWGYAPSVVADEANTNADLIKAVFIYNIAKFTRWPESTPPARSSQLTICVLGRDQVSQALPRLNERTIQGKSLNIVLTDFETMHSDECQVVYIASNLDMDLGSLLNSVAGSPILTISELPDFSHFGGMVELKQSKDRIRLVINLGVVKNAGLNISARLLNLATVINSGDGS